MALLVERTMVELACSHGIHLFAPSRPRECRRIAGSLGVAALAIFTVFAWIDAFASRFASGLSIALSALAIAFIAGTGPRFVVRARTAALTSLAWWLLLVLAASVVTHGQI